MKKWFISTQICISSYKYVQTHLCLLARLRLGNLLFEQMHHQSSSLKMGHVMGAACEQPAGNTDEQSEIEGREEDVNTTGGSDNP